MIREGGAVEIAARQNESDSMVLFSVDKGDLYAGDILEALRVDGKRRNLQWKLNGRDKAIRRIDVGKGEEQLRSELKADIDAGGPRRTFHTPRKYVVSFKDLQEARRFVREWHRRPFPVPDEREAKDEPPPIVNAEILW